MEFQFSLIPFYGIWRVGGLMLLGMACFKWGVLSARRSTGFYCSLVVFGGVLGLFLTNWTLSLNEASKWSTLDIMFTNAVPAYYGSVIMAFAWIGMVMVLARNARGLIGRTLAATGRMALTNYVAQSLLCSVLFYGWGVGLYGQFGYADQLMIVGAVWVLELIWSVWWLRQFHFGPLEWVWRSLVRWAPQPMLREAL
jgi:uncharacterized protein